MPDQQLPVRAPIATSGKDFKMFQWEVDEVDQSKWDTNYLADEIRLGEVKRARRPTVAIRLMELVVHNNRKLLREAKVRLDAITVDGTYSGNRPMSISTRTFSFERVQDGDHLPLGDQGLVLYTGKPKYFVELFLMVSRADQPDSDLRSLIETAVAIEEGLSGPMEVLATTGVIPTVDIVYGGLKLGLAVVDRVAASISARNGSTIGLFRGSWLGQDEFGAGRHPETGSFVAKDISFYLTIDKLRADNE